MASDMTLMRSQWLTGTPAVTGKLEDTENKKTNQLKGGTGSHPQSRASQIDASKHLFHKERRKWTKRWIFTGPHQWEGIVGINPLTEV